MAKFNQQPNKTTAGTNIQEVRQQNAQSQAGAGQLKVNSELNLQAKQMPRSKTTKPTS